MSARKVSIKLSQPPVSYQIEIGSGLLDFIGEPVVGCLPTSARRMALVSNKKVFSLYGQRVMETLARSGYQSSKILIGDGERFKNFRTLNMLLDSFAKSELTRSDAVIALGGGVVGDVTGFAAAVYLRGLPFLQVPTTLLAMVDASVGGKTGINSEFGKNTIGAFHQPAGVVMDTDVLRTLPRREFTAGMCEAVKQAAVAGGDLFASTAAFIAEMTPKKGGARNLDLPSGAELTNLLARHVKFKAEVVSGDELELPENIGRRSRKILNFGHTFAHALERATNYRYLKHGEAVGYGIRFAAALSKKLELLAADDVELLNDVVHRLGLLPTIAGISEESVLGSFKFDKKAAGGAVQWVLLEAIGKPVIVSGDKIPLAALKDVFKKIISD